MTCMKYDFFQVCESNLWTLPWSWPAWSLWRQGGISFFTQIWTFSDFDSNPHSPTACQCWTWQRKRTETSTKFSARLMSPIPSILESCLYSSLEVSLPDDENECVACDGNEKTQNQCWSVRNFPLRPRFSNFPQTLRALTGSWRLTITTTLWSTLARWHLIFSTCLLALFC